MAWNAYERSSRDAETLEQIAEIVYVHVLQTKETLYFTVGSFKHF